MVASRGGLCAFHVSLRTKAPPLLSSSTSSTPSGSLAEMKDCGAVFCSVALRCCRGEHNSDAHPSIHPLIAAAASTRLRKKRRLFEAVTSLRGKSVTTFPRSPPVPVPIGTAAWLVAGLFTRRWMVQRPGL